MSSKLHEGGDNNFKEFRSVISSKSRENIEGTAETAKLLNSRKNRIVQ